MRTKTHATETTTRTMWTRRATIAARACALLSPVAGWSQTMKVELRAFASATPSDREFLIGTTEGEPATVIGVLRLPAGAAGPVPAVVLHRLRARGADVVMHEFDGAHHAFDWPLLARPMALPRAQTRVPSRGNGPGPPPSVGAHFPRSREASDPSGTTRLPLTDSRRDWPDRARGTPATTRCAASSSRSCRCR